MFQVYPPWIFGGQVHLDPQWSVDPPERLLIPFREGVAPALRRIPTRVEARTPKNANRREQADADRFVSPAAHWNSQPHPDRRNAEAGQRQKNRDEHSVQADQPGLE